MEQKLKILDKEIKELEDELCIMRQKGESKGETNDEFLKRKNTHKIVMMYKAKKEGLLINLLN